MIDDSDCPFGENIKKTSEIVKIAHACGVSVEAKLVVASSAGSEESMPAENSSSTDPDGVVTFVTETGVDSLAVDVGVLASHVPQLDFEQLWKIKELVNLPLVLHDASGLSSEDLGQTIKNGVSKVNFDTDLSRAFVDGCKEMLLTNAENYDVRRICGRAREVMTELIKEKISALGSAKQCLAR
jgi:fructose-bisphosphate aldolase class II